MTLVYVYGSGECEQLGLGDDQPAEIKKPRKPVIFDLLPNFPARQITKIICGGMHTAALASNGSIYTWGNNDDKALGRQGAENVPLKVEIDFKANGVSAGDSCTIAYNTDSNQVFYWGCYKNVLTGKATTQIEIPTRIAPELFDTGSKLKLQKICSGSQHSLALSTCGKVFGWGDYTSGKIGRNLMTRNRDSQALRMEKVGAKNAVDIFCGNHHSFYINKQKQVFSWGLNQYGQLGIGTLLETATPSRIDSLDPYEGDYVVEIAGGEHHSMARTRDGLVYCWGRNDEGQCGQGDLFGEFEKKRKADEEIERLRKAEEEAKKAEEEAKNPPAEVAVIEEKKEEPIAVAEPGAEPIAEPAAETQIKEKKPKVVKKKEKAKPKVDELKNVKYFYKPRLIETLWKDTIEEGEDEAKLRKVCTQIDASSHYCYAVMEGQEVYAWGMGENYVLGNRKDENEFFPELLHPKMFEENTVVQMACGTQHCVALALDKPDGKVPELDIPKVAVPPQVIPSAQKVEQADENVQSKPVLSQPENAVAMNGADQSKKRTFEEITGLENNETNIQDTPSKKLKVHNEVPQSENEQMVDEVQDQNQQNGQVE